MLDTTKQYTCPECKGPYTIDTVDEHFHTMIDGVLVDAVDYTDEMLACPCCE